MAANGELFYPAEHAGFIAGDWDGLITYRVTGGRCEVTVLKSLRDGYGIGSALLRVTVSAAREAGCVDLCLVTTNDNLHALQWYRRKVVAVAHVDRGDADRSRD